MRLIKFMSARPNRDLSMPKLMKAAAGPGKTFVASLSRRISDARALGYQIIKSSDKYICGQRRTSYRLVTT